MFCCPFWAHIAPQVCVTREIVRNGGKRVGPLLAGIVNSKYSVQTAPICWKLRETEGKEGITYPSSASLVMKQPILSCLQDCLKQMFLHFNLQIMTGALGRIARPWTMTIELPQAITQMTYTDFQVEVAMYGSRQNYTISHDEGTSTSDIFNILNPIVAACILHSHASL